MMVLKTVSLLASVGLAAGNARFMIQDARCSRDVSVGANIMGVNAVASPHEIVMLESFPPQISIPGVTSGQLLFTASAGTFADGPQTGCSGARAWAYAGNTVSFNVPADVESYTIHVAHASGHGEVSIAEYVVGSPGAGGCAEDLDSDGLVNVNDLLGILSFFGSDGADGGDVDGNGVVDVNDLLQLLSAFGAECSGGGAGAAAAPCSYGEDCGGQQFTECGTMCPAECGSLPGIMCNMMCYNGFQCPNGQFWDENGNGEGSGICVAADDCSVPMPELPPGIAPGRPFLSAKAVPMKAAPVAAFSDWGEF